VEPGFSPLDEELELLPGRVTPSQQEHLVHLASWMPFAQAGQMMERLLGVQVSEATVRRMTEGMGACIERVQNKETEKAAASRAGNGKPNKLVISGDGAFVPLLGGEWAEVKMLAIGEAKPAGAAARVRGQLVEVGDLSYVARLATVQRFAELTQAEVERRGVSQAPGVCAVSDGAPWLQGVFDLHCPQAVRILDFAHAAQRLGSVASLSTQMGYPVAEDWLERQCHELKEHGPTRVLAALRQLPTPVQDSPLVQEHRAYLDKRIEQMQYPTYQQQGWPIGSGMVESANKLVMQARLKGSGMHWERAHVDPMLALRMAACNDRWEESWQAGSQQVQTQRARSRERLAQPRLLVVKLSVAWLLLQARPAPPPPPSIPLLPLSPPAMLAGTSRPSPHHPWKRAVLPCPKESAKK